MKTIVSIEGYMASYRGLQAFFYKIVYVSGPRPRYFTEPLMEITSYEKAEKIAIGNGWTIDTEPDRDVEPSERVSLKDLLR